MSEYQQYFNEYASVNSRWAAPEASECGCHGAGWWLSEVDTWHQCPYHGKDKRHPEDNSPLVEVTSENKGNSAEIKGEIISYCVHGKNMDVRCNACIVYASDEIKF